MSWVSSRLPTSFLVVPSASSTVSRPPPPPWTYLRSSQGLFVLGQADLPPHEPPLQPCGRQHHVILFPGGGRRSCQEPLHDLIWEVGDRNPYKSPPLQSTGLRLHLGPCRSPRISVASALWCKGFIWCKRPSPPCYPLGHVVAQTWALLKRLTLSIEWSGCG